MILYRTASWAAMSGWKSQHLHQPSINIPLSLFQDLVVPPIAALGKQIFEQLAEDLANFAVARKWNQKLRGNFASKVLCSMGL